MKRILIVEDDLELAKELYSLLSNSMYIPVILKDFSNALSGILSSNCDLILLDINLPYISGEILLKEIRKKSNVPIIMVTSIKDDSSVVYSMSIGADDYITKPYNPTILLLRIANIFRRCTDNVDVSYKNICINFNKGIIYKDNTSIILTKNEMIIFSYLYNNRNRIVTRNELMTDLWNNDEFVNDNALTVNISRLRSKLSSLDNDVVIETRKGIGYILL